MVAHDNVQRDERTIAVENAGYRWAYTFVAFALLIDVMYRAILHHEAAWDLMALVIVGGAICGIHQVLQKTLSHRSVVKASFIAILAGAVSAIVAVILAITKAF